MISDTGRVRLGQALKPLGTLDAARVWDLARRPGRRRSIAATGDEGKVFRRDAKDDDPWTVAYDADRHPGPLARRRPGRPRLRRHRARAARSST